MPRQRLVRGTKDIMKALMVAAEDYTEATGRALRAEGETIIEDAGMRTPVKTGRLRATRHVTDPVRGRIVGVEISYPDKERYGPGDRAQVIGVRTDGSKDVVSVGLGYGTDYAVYVHERTELHHDVGEAKFLEKAVQAHLAGMANRVGARVRRETLTRKYRWRR